MLEPISKIIMEIKYKNHFATTAAKTPLPLALRLQRRSLLHPPVRRVEWRFGGLVTRLFLR
ncbi:hypothetical protein HY416_00735 [Candidatus Kaiserbacteria bacterium]|nr:hypothetical protein [Candidatus Kaiserbacteria bacterium]